ncbi:hypothetical protein EV426DRAFT_333106 [Tirmania nivea]|nr:hypothetical protein EV426DRAFT_333106 [Tirmania nivea]
MYNLRNVVALLLLLSQSTAAVPPEYGTLTCTDVSAFGLPIREDCIAALATVKPGEPKVCTEQIQPEYNCATVGTCVIQTYSIERGRAHCLNGDMIINGINKILEGCYTPDGYTGGVYEWSAEDDEGVRLIRTPTGTA